MRSVDEVIQVSIDESLREASPFYEAMARNYIPALGQRIQEDLKREGYEIVPVKPPPKAKVPTEKRL